ncbi:nucleoside 2-deoxyribosyltransferase [Tautonia sociabilis]|uniref:nucleoside 2-deoxyribosyltransferase n=1 Tax=Tautonia sociabilis TaxID=2080755 RepID=UPI0013153F7F|nr:nucleoside 2-deoxyribosyltransferase [Tautonia sociabilis]
MRLYLAGPLFTQAERSWNAAIASALRSAGHHVVLPQEEVQHLEAPEAGPIFRLDVEGVRSADALVAILDGADPDSGTSFECGLAFALGIPIVAVRTDFRAGGDDLPGQRLPAINLMLSEAAAAVVLLPGLSESAEDASREILKALARLGPPPSPLLGPSDAP